MSKLGHNKPPKNTKQNFILHMRIFERAKWKKEAGQAGADLYEYYTYRNEMLKAKRKTVTETSVLIEGKVDMTARGAAYIISQNSKTDIYIAPKNTLNALHNDLVSVSVIKRAANKHRRGGQEKIDGRIVKVLQRHKTNFVGIL